MPGSEDPDVIIIGAGPAGLAAAASLSGSGINVLILEKGSFPRQKVCGGGLGIRSVNALNRILPKIGGCFNDIPGITAIRGIHVYAPDNQSHILKTSSIEKLAGYTIERELFDQYLVDLVKKTKGVQFLENHEVDELSTDEDGIRLKGENFDFRAPMVIIADGAHSHLAQQLTGIGFDKDKDAVAVRGIFKNTKLPDEEKLIEFFFFEEIFPGYLWIFPLDDNTSNVGLYIPLKFATEADKNYKRLLFDLIDEKSVLADRFQDAVIADDIEGGIIPLGKLDLSYSGDHFLIAGDAASLVDPLAGEGIGNALLSGEKAAEQILRCFEERRFDAGFNKEYDKKIHDITDSEFKTNHRVIKFFNSNPKVFSYLLRMVDSNQYMRNLAADYLAGEPLRVNPISYRFIKGLFT